MEEAGVQSKELRLWVPVSPEEVSARLERRLRLAGTHMAGAVAAGSAEFYVPRVRNAARAAQLVVEIAKADGGTLLKGRFTRHPSVWAFAVAAFLVSAFLALVALSYAVAQWSMGTSPVALFGLALNIVLGVGALLLLRFGPGGGGEHAQELEKFVEEAVRAP
jgi:hypothetical protein